MMDLLKVSQILKDAEQEISDHLKPETENSKPQYYLFDDSGNKLWCDELPVVDKQTSHCAVIQRMHHKMQSKLLW